MTLQTKLKQQLKARAHKLKPVVMIGSNGVTDNVIAEIDRALNDHELIKIRIQQIDRELKYQLFNDILARVGAEGVQFIGGIGVLFRKRPS